MAGQQTLIMSDGPRHSWVSDAGLSSPSISSVGASSAAQQPVERAERGLVGAPGTALQPPPQTTWGSTSFTAAFSPWTASPPTLFNPSKNASGPDDKLVQTQVQTILGGEILHQFYVYWVDGGAGNPYYVVILKQSGQLGPGQVLENGDDTRGFFQYQVDMSTTLVDAQDEPFASGVTLLGTSPATWSSSSLTGSTTGVTLGVEMMLDQAGTPVAFTAGADDALPLADWGVQNLTSMDGPAWTFHQVTGWDPTMDLPSAMEQWWKTVYPSKDKVIALPGASFADLGIETISAWQIQGEVIDQATRSCVVHFHFSITQSVGLFHNIDNCLGAMGSKHHHLFMSDWGGEWAWEFDLAGLLPPIASGSP